MHRQVEFMLGNEAMVAGALAAGADFYAGYPITPSSEVAELASKKLPAVGGTYIQMEDEIASIAAIIGASLAGGRAFTATSGPGFSLMQENLGLAYMAEVPCVVINVQRSGPSTGLATRPAQSDLMQSRWGTHGDVGAVVLSPATVQQCYTLTYKAFAYAQLLRSPVILLSDEIIGHLREDVSVSELAPVKRPVVDCSPQDYLPYQVKDGRVVPLASFGSQYVFHATGSMHDETGFPSSNPENAAGIIKRIAEKPHSINDDLKKLHRIHSFSDDEPEVVIISFGAAARAAREAAKMLTETKFPAMALELQCVWPVLTDVIVNCAAGRLTLVAEMNRGQLIGEVERILPQQKVIGVHRSDGEPLSPLQIVDQVERSDVNVC